MEKICFAGLGNPGDKYKNNRHNIGFLWIDYISDYFKFPSFRSFKSELDYSYNELFGDSVYLLKPMTYMNNSGIPLKKFMDYNNIPVENLIIIYDDIDIETGKLKIRKKGSKGGHNGMGSIIENFKTEDIKRIRVGVGPKKEGLDLSDYVLSDFSKEEFKKISNVIELSPFLVQDILSNGIDFAMSKYNK